MLYDVKKGPQQMKTVIDDENLHILSFFETCSQGKSEISSPSNPKLRPLLDGLSNVMSD